MSQAGSQAWAFYREVARTRVLWTACDDVGYPSPMTSSGKRAQPFWSSRSRAERIIASVPAYAMFQPEAVTWADFCEQWVPDYERDGLLIGVNWSGARARGFDIEPERVQQSVQALIDNPDATALGPEA